MAIHSRGGNQAARENSINTLQIGLFFGGLLIAGFLYLVFQLAGVSFY